MSGKSYSMSLIDQIILLQDVDNKLFEINKLLGDLPSKVNDLTDQEDSVKLSLQNKENDLKETSVLINTNETLVQTTSDKIDSLKNKLIDHNLTAEEQRKLTILGLKLPLTVKEIKKKYKKLVKIFHPDVNKNNIQAEIKFKEINEAYKVLLKRFLIKK